MSLSAQLRFRVNIQEKSVTQDPNNGEEIIVWTNLYTNVPAAIKFQSVKEFIAASAERSEIVARIMIRYVSGLDASMRIVHGTQAYDPEGWLPDNKSGREYLTAPCKLGDTDVVSAEDTSQWTDTPDGIFEDTDDGIFEDGG